MHELVNAVGQGRVGIHGHQHEGGRELHRGSGEADNETRENAAGHQWHDDAPHGAAFGGTQILRRLFQHDTDLLHSGHTGPQRIGQVSITLDDAVRKVSAQTHE